MSSTNGTSAQSSRRSSGRSPAANPGRNRLSLASIFTLSARWRNASLALLLATMTSAIGCATVPSAPTPTPLEQATRRASTMLLRAISRGLSAEENLIQVPFVVRYNPVSCDCPQWELFFRGRWTRVYLDTTSQSAPLLEELTVLASRDLEEHTYLHYRVLARHTTNTRQASTAMTYLVFILVGISLGDPQLE